MKLRTAHARWAVALVSVMALLPSLSFAQRYKQTNLVSDLADLAPVDAHLVNPWGLARSPTSPWWVANNGDGSSTLYNGNTGDKVPLTVTIPPPKGSSDKSTPTGTVFNG